MEEFKWSSNLAYAVGLLATDGCLSSDGRHFDLTSKDVEQLENFKKCLRLDVKMGSKSSGLSKKRYPRIQFGNVKLYRWLQKIGLTPHKSLTIGDLKVPQRYFFDFLRGSFDGDGNTYSYWDPRWKSSFMIYLQFTSASRPHLEWINDQIKKITDLNGRINGSNRAYQLVFAKKASHILIRKMYHKNNCIFLSRKRNKILKSFQIDRDNNQARMAKLAHALP